jgi:hypothetical protein
VVDAARWRFREWATARVDLSFANLREQISLLPLLPESLSDFIFHQTDTEDADVPISVHVVEQHAQRHDRLVRLLLTFGGLPS